VLTAILLPALNAAREKARQAKCISNLRQVGVSLETWYQNAGRYPLTTCPAICVDSSGWRSLAGWPEALALERAYTPENLEKFRDYLTERGFPPERFLKAADGLDIFSCPSDVPHPNRIDREKSEYWGFDPYEYSYMMNYFVSRSGLPGSPMWTRDLHKDSSGQILAADASFDFMLEFKAPYIENPDCHGNDPYWWSNSVNYCHGKNRAASFLSCDGGAKWAVYGGNGSGINTEHSFFRYPGETIEFDLEFE
jgi:hypothetical protein